MELKFKFNLAKPTEDGWYLVQNSENCIQPFTVALFEQGNFYLPDGGVMSNASNTIDAWARLEHPDSHSWLRLGDFRDIGLIDAHEENMSH